MEVIKYEIGEQVLERIRPHIKLIVTRYENNLYYCSDENNQKERVFVFFERELVSLALDRKENTLRPAGQMTVNKG